MTSTRLFTTIIIWSYKTTSSLSMIIIYLLWNVCIFLWLNTWIREVLFAILFLWIVGWQYDVYKDEVTQEGSVYHIWHAAQRNVIDSRTGQQSWPIGWQYDDYKDEVTQEGSVYHIRHTAQRNVIDSKTGQQTCGDTILNWEPRDWNQRSKNLVQRYQKQRDSNKREY